MVVVILSLFYILYFYFASTTVITLLLGAYSLTLLCNFANPWWISIDCGCILNYYSIRREETIESPYSLSFNYCIIIKSFISISDYFFVLESLNSLCFTSLVLFTEILLGESLLVPTKLCELFVDVNSLLTIDLLCCDVNLSLLLVDFGMMLLYFL
jgi:hypothetical protein